MNFEAKHKHAMGSLDFSWWWGQAKEKPRSLQILTGFYQAEATRHHFIHGSDESHGWMDASRRPELGLSATFPDSNA